MLFFLWPQTIPPRLSLTANHLQHLVPASGTLGSHPWGASLLLSQAPPTPNAPTTPCTFHSLSMTMCCDRFPCRLWILSGQGVLLLQHTVEANEWRTVVRIKEKLRKMCLAHSSHSMTPSFWWKPCITVLSFLPEAVLKEETKEETTEPPIFLSLWKVYASTKADVVNNGTNRHPCLLVPRSGKGTARLLQSSCQPYSDLSLLCGHMTHPQIQGYSTIEVGCSFTTRPCYAGLTQRKTDKPVWIKRHEN